MASVQTPSVTVAPELMKLVETYATDARQSVESVVEDALRFYLCDTPHQNALRRIHQERAAGLGLEMDAYIAAMMNEWREEDKRREDEMSRYIAQRSELEAMLHEGHEYGRSIGITCEEDVIRIANGEITLEQLRRPK